MDVKDFDLTMEQQFSLVTMTNTVQKMTEDQLREMLLELVRQLMVKDNIIRSMVRDGVL